MTTDEKFEEVLKVVREHGARLDDVVRVVRERGEKLDDLIKVVQAQGGRLDHVVKEVRETRELMVDERALNNGRFSQLSAGLGDVRKEVGDVKMEINKMNVSLNSKIDRVYDSLSQDIQVFAQDLHGVKRRVVKLEKHLPS